MELKPRVHNSSVATLLCSRALFSGEGDSQVPMPEAIWRERVAAKTRQQYVGGVLRGDPKLPRGVTTNGAAGPLRPFLPILTEVLRTHAVTVSVSDANGSH